MRIAPTDWLPREVHECNRSTDRSFALRPQGGPMSVGTILLIIVILR